ncbi:flagellar hook assembly protein FlgD [Parvibaculum sp.]|uniref:flagellar hook assembly protein FlgD n=1 Tax=Parvibaculum sp. TaxID=2024848 RepID=UPI00272579A5|nr:flagellar hook assembly protein FlgD [Parvibaculum sp.]MDO9127310.1 flagellar hook assembly protein FlgD [Parvibaculum sp.]MDP1628812.1 flagellar hook assembly protein FlgD [Parvibaculum sp.]MDP2148207.1 flagellar hook assembly protein FlgD [Parvibaculum sp.]MDP3329057.1 flagellar hook assembly protein FlgD [Parvibaculum sp.]
MDIASASAAVQAATSSNNSSTASAALAGNFDTFLKLLTTQLQHQDPTNPMSSDQFTQQLVQMSGVEQSIQTNRYLETLITANAIQNASQSVSLLGKEVTGSGTGTLLADGEAKWSFAVAADAPDTTLQVINADGATVYTEKMDATAGDHKFSWNGKDSKGSELPEGTYFLRVTANSASGLPVAVDTRTTGIVTAIDLSTTDPLLTVNGAQIRYSQITAVKEPAPAS